MLQSTGSFDVENIEQPESPAVAINSAEAVEIQSPLREFRPMIFLPVESERLFDFPRNRTNGALLSLAAEIRKDLPTF
jgi:hypothetical protein